LVDQTADLMAARWAELTGRKRAVMLVHTLAARKVCQRAACWVGKTAGYSALKRVDKWDGQVVDLKVGHWADSRALHLAASWGA